tara:strand:+ start:425 stop:592 length:168 start_codon:yes stop_codon:yes gene_type:complete
MKKVVKPVEEKVEEQKLTKITYEIETVNKVLQYLTTRPYGEVQELFSLLQKGELS